MSETTATVDQDPCSSQNLPASVQETNRLMREFDGVFARVAQISSDEIPKLISELQRIRRTAEDLPVPACLIKLKSHQLNNMNLTIDALLASVGGAHPSTLDSTLETARREHDLYSLELVRLLGITLAPVTVTPPVP